MRGYGGEKKGENYRNLVSRNEKNKSWERKIRSLYLQSESDEGDRDRDRDRERHSGRSYNRGRYK